MNDLFNDIPTLLLLAPCIGIAAAWFMHYLRERREKELLAEAEELQTRLANIKREAEKKLNEKISRIINDGCDRIYADFERWKRDELPVIEAKERAKFHAIANDFIASQTKTIQFLNGTHKS